MAVKILICREMTKEQAKAVHPYLLKLTALAVKQPGYISGETLVDLNDPEKYIIICTWHSEKDWEKFLELEESKELHYCVDQILVKMSELHVCSAV